MLTPTPTPTTPNFNCNSPPFLIKIKRRAKKCNLHYYFLYHEVTQVCWIKKINSPDVFGGGLGVCRALLLGLDLELVSSSRTFLFSTTGNCAALALKSERSFSKAGSMMSSPLTGQENNKYHIYSNKCPYSNKRSLRWLQWFENNIHDHGTL